VTILGALLLFEHESGPAVLVLGGVALATAAFNLVGGYAITYRMLRMFRRGSSGRTA
jgi:NAD(P) transhydrogenase subunit alpha